MDADLVFGQDDEVALPGRSILLRESGLDMSEKRVAPPFAKAHHKDAMMSAWGKLLGI
jgi:hypothetical protein